MTQYNYCHSELSSESIIETVDSGSIRFTADARNDTLILVYIVPGEFQEGSPKPFGNIHDA